MYLRLFDSVRISEGAKRAIIFDTTSGFLNFIPKSFSALLSDENQNYSLLLEELDNESKKTLQQYIDFILKNHLGFIVKSLDELACFKKSKDVHFSSSEVDYLIFDLYPSDLTNDIVQQIDDLGIKFVQLRVLEQSTYTEILKLFANIELFNNTSVNEVSIVLSYSSDLEECIIKGDIIKSSIFLQFIFHSCTINEMNVYGNIQISKTNNKIKIPFSCGCINLNNLNINRSFYIEALNHNSCLHKKISIDYEGYIKNCPSMVKNFGNIKQTSLRKALLDNDFKEYWDINKDKIEVCKDCEFRYLCTDCRAYTEKGENDPATINVSKPLKCGYDPYTGIWEDWSINPLKEKAIKFYGLQEILKY